MSPYIQKSAERARLPISVRVVKSSIDGPLVYLVKRAGDVWGYGSTTPAAKSVYAALRSKLEDGQ